MCGAVSVACALLQLWMAVFLIIATVIPMVLQRKLDGAGRVFVNIGRGSDMATGMLRQLCRDQCPLSCFHAQREFGTWWS